MGHSYSIIDFLAVFGATNALVFLHVGAPFRRLLTGYEDKTWKGLVMDNELIPDNPLSRFRVLFLGRLAHCHACCGFWVGFIYHLAFNRFEITMILDSFQFGLASSTFCFATWVVMHRLGANKL